MMDQRSYFGVGGEGTGGIGSFHLCRVFHGGRVKANVLYQGYNLTALQDSILRRAFVFSWNTLSHHTLG